MKKTTILVIGLLLVNHLQGQHLRRERQIFETYFNKSSKLRYKADALIRYKGYTHPTLKALDLQIIKLDKLYIRQFLLTIKRCGWLSKAMVGARAARGFYLLLYNADTAIMKQYLPLAKKAVIQKRLSKHSYARLYDQFLVSQGKLQYYGTCYYWDVEKKQYFFYEIADIDAVNRRRTLEGLPAIEASPPGFTPFDKISLLPAQQVNTGYADTVLSSYYSGAHPGFKQLYGGKVNVATDTRQLQTVDPQVVVKDNNQFVSLPNGSYVIVGFGDNSVIDAPDQPDLFIEETGPAGDQAKIYVSADGKNFKLLGIADDGKQTMFDLASIDFKEPVVAVKVEGIDFKGAYPGFDLVSVRAMIGAVGEAQPSLPWYKPSKLPRKLKNVLFAFNRWDLTPTAKDQINKVIQLMKKYPGISLELIGHTDMTGKDQKNMELSRQRVEEVYHFMTAKGISKNKLHKKFFGKRKLLYKDQLNQQQALNRRVEFRVR